MIPPPILKFYLLLTFTKVIILKKIFFIITLLSYYLGNTQDLQIANIEGISSIDQYTTPSLTITITNTGIVDINKFSITNLYLSLDSTLTSEDYYVGFTNLSKIVAKDSVTKLCYCEAVDLSPGTYYLIAQTDKRLEVTETDESNNGFIIPNYTIAEPDFDLSISNFTLEKSTAHWDEAVHLNYKIQNLGTTDLGGALYTSFYLSTDNQLDSSDIKLEYYYADLTGPDIILSPSFHIVTIPTVAPGVYYIIGKVDSNYNGASRFEESNTSNNVIASGSLNILPGDIDLKITRAPILYFDPTNFNLFFDVTNGGTTGVIGYNATLYFSADATLNESDYQFPLTWVFDHKTWDYLPGGATQNKSISYFIGDSFFPLPPPGDYFIIVELNKDRSILETDTTNNVAVSASRINIPAPILPQISLDTARPLDIYNNIDRAIELDVDFINVGTNYITGVSQFYRVTIKDSLSNIVYSNSKYQFFYLSPQDTTTIHWIFNLDAPLEIGEYQISIECLSPVDCYTNSYNMPLSILEFVYKLEGEIKGEDSVSITKGNLFLYKKGSDGIVEFTDRLVLDGSNSFNFFLKNHNYTLYFIPDKINFSEYVPTVLGKTVTLNDSSFFSANTDTSFVFQILKINSLSGTGNRTIYGTVSIDGDSGGRKDEVQSVANLPVILLSSTGEIVGQTYTDDLGNYEFANLPSGVYQVFIAFELDGVIMDEPSPVDVSMDNSNLNFTIGDKNIQSKVEVATSVESVATKIPPYPNPFQQRVIITNSIGLDHVEVFELSGRLVKRVEVKDGSNELDLGFLNSGIYFIKGFKNGQAFIQKLVKQ